MIKYKHPTPISGYIQFAQKGDKIGEYRRVNPEDYVIDPNTGNRRNKYTGQEVTFIPEGFDEEGVVVTGKRIYPMFSPGWRAQKAEEQNERDKVIASQYFDQAPSIGNLVKGAYHFTRGTLLPRSENPEDYNPVQTLTAPDAPMFSRTKLMSLVTRGKLPRLMQKVGEFNIPQTTQETTKIGGLPIPTGKRRTLKEIIGLGPKPVSSSNTAKTFEDGVREGYWRGFRKGTQKAEGSSNSPVTRQQEQNVERLTQNIQNENPNKGGKTSVRDSKNNSQTINNVNNNQGAPTKKPIEPTEAPNKQTSQPQNKTEDIQQSQTQKVQESTTDITQ